MRTQNFIHNGDAYERGKQRNIMRNASKGRLKRWLAAGEDHQELYDWLDGSGQYADVDATKEVKGDYCENCGTYVNAGSISDRVCEDCGNALATKTYTYKVPHSLCEKMWNGDFGDFLMKLTQILVGGHYDFIKNTSGEDVEWWGQLSTKQTTVVRNALARAKENLAKKDEREAQWAAESASREYVGEVGDKKFNVEGTIAFTTNWEGTYGITFLTVIRDANDNTIKYKGNCIGHQGDKIKMIATIKAHEEYKGEKQTIVQRPRKIEIG